MSKCLLEGKMPNELLDSYLEIQKSGKYNMFEADNVVKEMLSNNVHQAIWLCEERYGDIRVNLKRYSELLKVVEFYYDPQL